MTVFYVIMDSAKPIFAGPPAQIQQSIVFEPSTCSERGWILLFNALLSTNLSLTEPQNTRLIRGLQWNAWMVLEESNLLMEPSELNIQALTLVACHCQDFITPSVCWTLISNACLLSRAMSLHLPSPTAPLDSEANRQRNCLFWSLFIVDKSLSMAFGRPALLPNHLYKDVPLPDPNYLAKFNPHQAPGSPDCKGSEPGNRTAGDNFGSLHWSRLLEFAKFQGDVSDLLHQSKSLVNIEKVSDLLRDLDRWMKTTREVSALSRSLLKADIGLSIDNGILPAEVHRRQREEGCTTWHRRPNISLPSSQSLYYARTHGSSSSLSYIS